MGGILGAGLWWPGFAADRLEQAFDTGVGFLLLLDVVAWRLTRQIQHSPQRPRQGARA